ncbi:MAG: MOSC domain-containing protein, partial [Gemmatimonadales bacterium]
MHLSYLHIYPIKSCGGITVTESEVDVFGLKHDRRFMVVTPRGEFITQREVPALATVRVNITGPHLRLDAPELPTLTLALTPLGGRPVVTQVWDDTVRAVAPDPAADDWFSSVVGQE